MGLQVNQVALSCMQSSLLHPHCVMRSSAGCFVKIYRVNICNFFSSLFGVTSNPYRRVIPIKSNPYRRVIPVKSNPRIRVISV